MARSQGPPREAIEITPAYWCSSYLTQTILFFVIALIFIGIANLDTYFNCYMELFTNSVSVTNVSNATADWRIGFVAKSPATGCEITLRRPYKSRLLRGDQVIISKPSSSLSDFYSGLETNVAFETPVMPEVVNGSVIWDFRVEFVTEMKTQYYNRRYGFLMVYCGDIPVKFTADHAGNMMGSLLGSMRRCDYLIKDNLDALLS